MKESSLIRILPGVIDFVIITMVYKSLNYSILFLWEINEYFLFSFCFIVYYLLCYLGFNSTPGHYVFSQVNEQRNPPLAIVSREAIKTIVFPGIPVAIILLMQIRFNPYLYALFVVSCIILLLFNVSLKKHIWDFLVANRWRMEHKRATLPVILFGASLMFIALNIYWITRLDPFDAKPYPYPANASVEPYTDWLVTNKPGNAVDYMFSLFEKYDHVIISERTHTEYTQYEFLMELISDSRFTCVRNIHFEFLNANYQDEMQNFVHTSFADDEVLNEKTAEALT